MAIFLGILLLLGIGIVLRGVTLAVLWDWFVAGPGAVFENIAPAMSTAQALGFALVISFLVYQEQRGESENKDKSAGELLALGFVKVIGFYAIIWAFALLYRSFI